VWCFFSEPVDAWIPRGLMRDTIIGVGKPSVEIFPKQDKLLEGMLGNYINLPYFGETRKMMGHTLQSFLTTAEISLCDPTAWLKRAQYLMIAPPDERETNTEFGTGTELHQCAQYVIKHREDKPIVEGHRAVVYFCLAKQFAHYEGFSREDSLEMLKLVNDASPDPITDYELTRALNNAERGRFTSTGCSDPVFQPYADPECPIAKGER
jgi:hypothetical protein